MKNREIKALRLIAGIAANPNIPDDIVLWCNYVLKDYDLPLYDLPLFVGYDEESEEKRNDIFLDIVNKLEVLRTEPIPKGDILDIDTNPWFLLDSSVVE